MSKIYVEAPDVWGYASVNKLILEHIPKALATNEEYGITIELMVSDNLPAITVYVDDELVDDVVPVNAADCNASVHRLYEDYLTDKCQGILCTYYGESEEGEDITREDEIDSRELDLLDAIIDALSAICVDTPTKTITDIAPTVLEHLLRYLYKKHGISVYRPTFLEDDSGEFYTEYPYEILMKDA